REDLLGRPIRITTVDAGLVETEFSVVRFKGDTEKADAVYKGIDPLTADDIADCVLWAVTRPWHVNIDEIVVKARDQSSGGRVHTRSRLASRMRRTGSCSSTLTDTAARRSCSPSRAASTGLRSSST